MLTSLFIQNFALLNEVKLDFKSGYTVITGETGSGKSILLNALNLILGERADFKVIGPRSDKAIVEAEFSIQLPEFDIFFSENDLDFFETTIVRREISSQGRSRAFINDVPVQLNVLKAFTDQLVSIHSQYNTLDLKRKEYQLNTLDILAGLTVQKGQYQSVFENYKHSEKELEQLKIQLNVELKDKDYNEFQLAELQNLQLLTKDYSALELELNRLENLDEIKSIYSTIQSVLEDENAVIDRLSNLKSSLSKVHSLDPKFIDFDERITTSIIDLKDLVATVNDQLLELDGQPINTGDLMNSVDEYNRALNKYKLNSQTELITFLNELEALVSNSDELGFAIEKLEKEVDALYSESLQLAEHLHSARVSASAIIEDELTTLLSELKLPDTKVKFALQKADQMNLNGISKIEFLFSANKGIGEVAIENAASGGELSRVMLALQKMISTKRRMPTVFFDEIDTGVSGDVAQKIGNLLNSMGETMQLISITHLPQVAAKASHHLRVEKSSEGEITQTKILELSTDERINEIARLMSGEQITDAAISNAKALMH